jgi:hypothetical protein
MLTKTTRARYACNWVVQASSKESLGEEGNLFYVLDNLSEATLGRFRLGSRWNKEFLSMAEAKVE